MKELLSKWYEKGIKAGKEDAWMDFENTLKDDKEKYNLKDVEDLIEYGKDLWEETDHFRIIYGEEMMRDAERLAGDKEETIEIYLNLKNNFWEGFFTGRKEIGIDIYQIAENLE